MILVIGRHADMMEKVLNLLKQHHYEAIGATNNDEAITTFKNNPIQVVIIGGGVDAESRNLFQQEFSALNPQIKIIDAHPSTILSELKKANNLK